MELDFEFDTPNGTVQFKGTLAKEEVEWVVKYGFLHLLQAGALPIAIANVASEEGGETSPKPGFDPHLN